MKTLILLSHGRLPLVDAVGQAEATEAQRAALGTFAANLAYYGYVPALSAFEQLRRLSESALGALWRDIEPVLRELTGANRPMAQFVVYKNFPREVLALSEAQYWLNQIFMYLGAPSEWFTEPPLARKPLDERLQLKVLVPAEADALSRIWQNLVDSPTRWTNTQWLHAQYLARELKVAHLDLTHFGFKENGLRLAADVLTYGVSFSLTEGTDVLRLAAALSGQDAGLRGRVWFRRFKRPERRMLLELMESAKHLEADMALRPSAWKKLLARLHPGDYDVPRVHRAYDALYRGTLPLTFNAQVEAVLATRDPRALDLLAQRPGEFVRRLRKTVSVFGDAAVAAFAAVADTLPTVSLLKLRTYLRTLHARTHWLYAPRGNWKRVQVHAANKTYEDERQTVTKEHVHELLARIDAVLAARLNRKLPDGVALDPRTRDVKLQTNDQELAPYGRGTVFELAPSVRFVRTASYWQLKKDHNVWFDNGWGFFDEAWRALGACCWNSTHAMGPGAVFSGDPTNVADRKGRACQMIDLDLDELARRGVRYAVWSVLSYNYIPFAQADDVLATLQWGEHAEQGALYEPARAQMVFALKGNSLTKYVAYLDLAARTLVYMDADLGGTVRSAAENVERLQQLMPAFQQYLASLPSVADLFANAKAGAVPVLYSDADARIEDDALAYVFRPVNANNTYKPLELQALLAD